MSLFFDFTVTINGVDVSEFVFATGTIDYGRQGRGTSFSAPRAVFEMYLPESNPNPAPSAAYPSLAKRQSVVIHVTWDGLTQHRRFTGRIQALDYSRTFVTVTATGNTVDYGRYFAGATNSFAGRAVESDSDRVEWLAEDAPHALTIEGSPGRRLRQIERNSNAQELLDGLVRIAANADGLLLEDRLGVPRYRTRNFTFPARYTIPHAIVDSSDLELSTDAGDEITTAVVYYGEPSKQTGLRTSVTDVNTGLNAAIGYDVRDELDTDLRTIDGATGRAAQYLLQNNGGYYIPDLPLLMSAASTGQADDILDLQEGWPVTVESLPEGWPVESLDCDVIGFTEIMHQTDYRIVLHLEPSYELNEEDDSDPIYPDGSLTGYDSTGTETISGKEFRWCRWDESGFVTNLYTESAMYLELVAIARGGDGGTSSGLYGRGGSGGDGGFLDDHIDLNPGTWPILVGDDTNDGDTVFYGTRLYRGGDGGSAASPDGKDGGCGGGGLGRRDPGPPYGDPGTGVLGQGYDGLGDASGGVGGPATSPGVYTFASGPDLNVEIGGETVTFGGECGGGGRGDQAGGILWPADPGQPGRLYLRYRIG